ncbi:MAG: hypothetical protein WBW84_18905 [Acidobacteriaceae bacterium]
MIDWTPELEDKIADLLESKSLLTVCAENPDLPSRASINRHLDSSAAFETKCARARKNHALKILEAVQTEVLTAKTKEAAYVANVKASHAQWYVTKLLPRIFGDRTVLAGDPENPLAIGLASRISEARKRDK